MATMVTPTTAGGCGCGCGPGDQLCDDPAGLVRTRFFPGQLVGPADFTQDQRYFREKHRRHNRMLHGWGVVCGVETVVFDVRRVADDLRGGCPPPLDPWCSPVRVDRDPRVPLYLAIRYDECETQPVQTESGCGCGSE